MAKGKLRWSGLATLVGAVRSARPDLIQGWIYHVNFAATMLRDLALICPPTICSIHNTLVPKVPFAPVTMVAYQASRLMAFRLRATVHVSQAAAEQHEAVGFRRDGTLVIANGTDCGGTGTIVPPTAVEPLALALADLMAKSPEDRLSVGKAARQRVTTQFFQRCHDYRPSGSLPISEKRRARGGGKGRLSFGTRKNWGQPMHLAAPDDPLTAVPRLGVIMPCWNEKAIIRRSISLVLAFDYPAERMTLTLVAGMSTDATKAIVQDIARIALCVRMLENPNASAPALNLGLAHLDCDVVLRVDAHSIYPAHYASVSVAALWKAVRRTTAGWSPRCPVRMRPPPRKSHFHRRIRLVVAIPRIERAPPNGNGQTPFLFGCWRLETVRNLGGFSTDIPYGEDDELNGRIIASGGRILLDPAIQSEHVARATSGKIVPMLYRHGRSKPATTVRLRRMTTLRQLVPLVFVLTLAGSVGLAFAWPPFLLIGLAAVVAHLLVGTRVAVTALATRGLNLSNAIRLQHTLMAGHTADELGYMAGLVSLLKARKSVKNVCPQPQIAKP